MLPDLQLRQVGTRHVASVVEGGQRKDVGEVQEAHLRAYCASLPGSYVVPDSKNVAGMSRGNRRIEVTTFSKGEARQNFTQAVEAHKRRLLSEDSTLTELEAHRMAMQRIAQADPALLAAYRADVEEI